MDMLVLLLFIITVGTCGLGGLVYCILSVKGIHSIPASFLFTVKCEREKRESPI